MRATYFYRFRTRSGYDYAYTLCRMPVEVIGESAKSYQVRYLALHENGEPKGTTAWVGKSKVHFKPTAEPTRSPYID